VELLSLVAVAVALIAGLVVGWLLAGRPAAVAQRERVAAEERARTAETALALAEQRAAELPPLRLMLDGVREERDEAQRQLAAARPLVERVGALERELGEARGRAELLSAEVAGFRRGEDERGRAHDAQLATLKEMELRLHGSFGELAGKALGEAQKHFLERADARFRQAEETSGQSLKALLQPVSERLQRYEETVGKVEAERREAYGNLTGLIDGMRAGQEAVRSEAARLVNSLRSAPKARGRWGEQQLRNVLETCGLAEHTDFLMEVSVADEAGEGRLRPDAIVTVPGGRSLVIDAKVSLNAYQDAYGAVDDVERERHLTSHAAAMRSHVTGLSAKAYWSQFADAPDYVIMFVPGEHFLAGALEHDPGLWDFAFDKRVLLATPTNLIAIARTVAAVWRQEKLAKEAQQIGELGKEMHDRLAVAADKLRRVGGGLGTAVRSYNEFVASFEGRLMVTGRKFRDLNIETGARELESVLPVEAMARHGDADAALPPPPQDVSRASG